MSSNLIDFVLERALFGMRRCFERGREKVAVRELALLNQAADQLNPAAEDVLGYQALP